MTTSISVKEISKKLNIPVDIIIWNIKNDKNLRPTKDYTLIKGEYGFSVTGFIWFLGLKLSSDYDALLELLSLYFENSEETLFENIQKVMKEYSEKNLKTSKEDKADAPAEEKGKVSSYSNNFVEESDVPKTTDPVAIEWSNKTRAKIKMIIDASKKTENPLYFMVILKKTYNKMRELGFDFDAAKYSLLSKHNLPKSGVVSMWRIIEESKEAMDLFDLCLDDITPPLSAKDYIGAI